jgi:hypothetical protein
MLPKLLAVAATLPLLGFFASLPAATQEAAPDPIRSAVAKAVPLLQQSAAEYTRHRQCFACHHQALPLLALTTAQARGVAVSQEEIDNQRQFTADSLAKNRDGYEKGIGQGGQVDTAGYALLALEVSGWKPEATTAAVAEYLLRKYKDQDHWPTTSKRPPSEVSPFTTTYLALRGLRTFGTPEQQERIAARTEQVRQWLLATPATDTEDRVFRLGALKLADAPDKEVQAAAQELVQSQRTDGGWGQTDELDSDAYATGSTLVLLHQVNGLATTDPIYQRGVKFLITEQLEDGSWHVKSRSKPFQIYFETGFPHGTDQFISIAASSWATTALALACPRP